MSTQFSKQNNKLKRFSIDDAFEEETDEAIKVYGTNINHTTTNGKLGHGDSITFNMENGRGYKSVTEPSRDSDSLIQDYYEGMDEENLNRSCFMHPKVRENWRMVLAATTLLIVGIGLLITGTHTLSEPNSLLQASVFLLAGLICFIPGAYHVVYIYLAAKGKRGYHFHNLPLFT